MLRTAQIAAAMQLLLTGLLPAVALVGAVPRVGAEITNHNIYDTRDAAPMMTPAVPRVVYAPSQNWRAAYRPPEGELAAALSSSTDDTPGRVTLFNPRTRRVIHTFSAGRSALTAVAFHPFSPFLAIGGADGQITVWNPGPVFPEGQLLGHQGKVNGLDFSQGGGRLVSWSDDRTVILWESRTRLMLRRFTGHTAPVMAAAMLDSNMIASASLDGRVLLFDVDSGVATMALRGARGEAFTALAVNHAEELIAAGTNTGRIYVWSREGTLQFSADAHRSAVESLSFSPDGGKILASGGRDGRVVLWNTASGVPTGDLSNGQVPVHDARFSARGDQLLSASADNTIRRWDVIGRAVLERYVLEESAGRSGVEDWMLDAAKE